MNLTNTFSRSIKTFFSESNKKVDGGEAVQKKRKEVDLDSEVENEMKKINSFFFIAYILIVLFALLPKISSIVYKKGSSLSASNKQPLQFGSFGLFFFWKFVWENWAQFQQ